MASDVAAFVQDRGLGPVALIGHSLGGKVARRLSLLRPDLVQRLVVVDVAPVAYASTFGPFVEAMRRVDLAALPRRADADVQLQSAVPDGNFLLQNLVKTDAGFVWRVNSKRSPPTWTSCWAFAVPASEAAYLGPTLLIAGGRSRSKQPEHRPLIARLFPNAEHVVIAGAGHWPHAERPAEFLTHVRGFLA